ncbi:hypothetical protein PISMIDRAFT_78586, partial [Pisolithus microcarpus 441]
VSLKEQLAIFLYTSVTSLTTRHHISEFYLTLESSTYWYFCKLLFIFSSSPFY